MITLRTLLLSLLIVGLLAAVTPTVAQSVHYDLASTSVLRINLPVSQAVTVTMNRYLINLINDSLTTTPRYFITESRAPITRDASAVPIPCPVV